MYLGFGAKTEGNRTLEEWDSQWRLISSVCCTCRHTNKENSEEPAASAKYMAEPTAALQCEAIAEEPEEEEAAAQQLHGECRLNGPCSRFPGMHACCHRISTCHTL